MTEATLTEAPPVTAMNQSSDRRVLGTIAMQNVAVALWQRDLSTNLGHWLSTLAPESLPQIRCRTGIDRVADAVQQACNEAGTPAGPRRQEMIADIADLARQAAAATGAPQVDLRLEATEGQACPKWHLDAVVLRLLCTLRGPGTQFGAARPGGGDPAAIHQMRSGDVALLRGKLWQSRRSPGVLHRSPPAQSGQTRLLLVIDPVTGTA